MENAIAETWKQIGVAEQTILNITKEISVKKSEIITLENIVENILKNKGYPSWGTVEYRQKDEAEQKIKVFKNTISQLEEQITRLLKDVNQMRTQVREFKVKK